MINNQKQLIIFVKSPVIGECKTRLAPLLGGEGATNFYKDLMNHIINVSGEVPDIDIALYASPGTQHPFIQKLANTYCASLHSQQGNDLGERMYSAMQHSLQKYQQCVLIGSDCPGITADYINKAFTALESHNITLGPAKDGGYVLIGATRIHPEIFINTEWSTNRVLQQCITNIKHRGLSYRLLETLWDIDTPEDFIQNQLQIEHLLKKTYLKDSP